MPHKNLRDTGQVCDPKIARYRQVSDRTPPVFRFIVSVSNRCRDRVSAPMKVLLSPISRPKHESLTGQTRQTRQEEETTRFQDTEQPTTVLGFYTVSLGAYPWIQTAEARPSISLALQVRDAEPRLSRTSLALQERSTMPRRRGDIGTSSLSSSVRFPSVSMPYTSL